MRNFTKNYQRFKIRKRKSKTYFSTHQIYSKCFIAHQYIPNRFYSSCKIPLALLTHAPTYLMHGPKNTFYKNFIKRCRTSVVL